MISEQSVRQLQDVNNYYDTGYFLVVVVVVVVVHKIRKK